jgi:hypothetical protein
MNPVDAVREILTFEVVNEKLSPVQDSTPLYGRSLEELQDFWSSDHPANPLRQDLRRFFNLLRTRSDGSAVLSAGNLQNTWIAAVNKRGLNPFRQKVGFWLTNYHMSVNLRDVSAPLIRDHFDSAMDSLEEGLPFDVVLAMGASSAAAAREYGHQNNRYNNGRKTFTGNDDFAREFHQLFFLILGAEEDPDYHENVTIEHTAWMLTGMQLDHEENAYGSSRRQDWWLAPIDYSNHRDPMGRRIFNTSLHYRGSLEILHQNIVGSTAEEKIFQLAQIAIENPESLRNLPVAIVNYFADDNLNDEKIKVIREAWAGLEQKNLLAFLQNYASSTAFHSPDTVKFRTAFNRNMTIYNLNTVDNTESYATSYSPKHLMRLQGAELFIPAHDVFGGQTSLNAANNPNIFKEAYNGTVDNPNRIAKTRERYTSNSIVRTWEKDWTRLIPHEATDGYRIGRVAAWLWQRFISDGGENYTELEEAYVTGFLATGFDLGYLASTGDPDITITIDQLKSATARNTIQSLQRRRLQLRSNNPAARREANRRVGMAVNFITMTPFMFAMEGQ